MNWLRSKAKRLSLLALFALTLQFGLSFGHTHLDRAFAGTATISDQASKSSSDTGRDNDARHDICAICATIALANALIDTLPPVLPLPVAAISPSAAPFATGNAAALHALGFQSRAPPRS